MGTLADHQQSTTWVLCLAIFVLVTSGCFEQSPPSADIDSDVVLESEPVADVNAIAEVSADIGADVDDAGCSLDPKEQSWGYIAESPRCWELNKDDSCPMGWSCVPVIDRCQLRSACVASVASWGKLPDDPTTTLKWSHPAGEAVLEDARTGLGWDLQVSQSREAWGDAYRRCVDSKWAGFDDWRLPSIPELLSIVDYSTATELALQGPFSNGADLRETWLWSTELWLVSPFDIRAPLSKYWKGRTICVRGGPHPFFSPAPPGEHDYVPPSIRSRERPSPSGESVLDLWTGVHWQVAGTSGYNSLAEAEAYCASLKIDGVEAWRVPDIREVWDALMLPEHHHWERWLSSSLWWSPYAHDWMPLERRVGYDEWVVPLKEPEYIRNLVVHCVSRDDE
ncbi:MAG: DUF1566 domain-containing protein [Deltaproteobacteria bacterium]|nr:DUF1566 domain-containing protein [Deltaproteobacteria bacterium]